MFCLSTRATFADVGCVIPVCLALRSLYCATLALFGGCFSQMAGAASSSACTKGFAISSLPSRGEMRTRRVPRATRRPRGLDEVLPSSSVVK